MVHSLSRGMIKIVKSTQNAFRGIASAYRRDESFRLEVNWGIPVYAVLLWLFWPLRFYELVPLIGSYLWILRTELLNTGVEFALDHLHPGRHENIGASKDAVSAGVLMEFCFAGLVVLLIAGSRWFGWGV